MSIIIIASVNGSVSLDDREYRFEYSRRVLSLSRRRPGSETWQNMPAKHAMDVRAFVLDWVNSITEAAQADGGEEEE